MPSPAANIIAFLISSFLSKSLLDFQEGRYRKGDGTASHYPYEEAAVDLAQEVKNSLDNAVTEVSAQPSDPDYLTINVGTSGTTRTISYDVKTDNTIGDAINDNTKKGLATVEDVAAYLKARLSVKVVS